MGPPSLPVQLVKWLVTQINNFTNKNVIGEGLTPESIATLLAVALTV